MNGSAIDRAAEVIRRLREPHGFTDPAGPRMRDAAALIEELIARSDADQAGLHAAGAVKVLDELTLVELSDALELRPDLRARLWRVLHNPREQP